MHTVGVRAEKPEDAKAIRQINKLAFDQPDEANLVEALRRSPKFDPELSRVFDKDGEIVGHILFSPAEIKTTSRTVPVLVLGPMSVHPDHQRHGIGERLINRGLEVARKRGHKAVVLVGHAEYYPRFGFRPASGFGIESPFPTPDENFMALELEDGALNEAEGMMEYPPEFAEII
jgi:putative acetyltransferase